MSASTYTASLAGSSARSALAWAPVAAAMVLAAAAIALLPLGLAAIVVVGALATLVSLVRVEYGLSLLALAVPFESLKAFGMGDFSITFTEVLCGLLALAWLGHGAVHRRLPLVVNPMAVVITLFVVLVAVSVGVAESLGLALKELLRWLQVLLVYLLVVSLARQTRWQKLLVAALFVAAGLEVLLGVYQFFTRTGPPSFGVGSFLRAYGTFGQPNPYAGYLGMVAPLAYALAFFWGRRARIDWLRLLAWLVLAGTLAASLMSFSRGGWMGLAMALVAVTALASRRGAVLTAVGLVVLASLAVLGMANLLPASILGRLSILADYFSIFDVREVLVTPENWALVERMAHWQAAWYMYEDHVLFGVGIGNYVAAYPSYYLTIWKDPLGHAHNLYLNMLAEMGAIGLVGYLLMVGSWFGLGLLSLRRSEPGFSRALALGCLGVLTASAAHNVFDNLYVHGLNVHLAIILGLLSLAGSKPSGIRRELNWQEQTKVPWPR